MIDPNTEGLPSDINEVIRQYQEQPAIDLDGRFYFRLTERILYSAQIRFGEDGRVRKLGATLKELGFEKREKIRTMKYRSTRYESTPVQVNVWISPKGFIMPDLIKEYHEEVTDRIKRYSSLKLVESKAIEEPKEIAAIPGADIKDDFLDI